MHTQSEKASEESSDSIKAPRKPKISESGIKPKRACNPFIYFLQSKFNEVKSAETQKGTCMKGHGIVNKILAKMWSEMSDSDKMPYVKMRAEDLDRKSR